MPEDKNATPSSPADAGHVPITEELDSAKWTLPPIKPLLIALVLVTIVFAVIILANKSKPTVAGTITKVVAVQQGDQAIILAVQLKLDNLLEQSFQVEEIHAEVETAEGRVLTDQAAPGVDNERYLKAVPELREAQAGAFRSEQVIPSKGSYTGVTIYSFPIDKAAFERRKSLKLRIDMQGRPSAVVKQ